MKTESAIVTIGGSAGSLDIVLKLLPSLTASIALPVIVVLHRKNSSDTLLADLLSTRTHWLVKEADEKEKMISSVIYIAPADYHLLIESDHTFSLDASEKVNYSRPSIDVTFESAAEVFGPATVGILLSGANADGVEGMKTIKTRGGMIIVQNPATAAVPYMPQKALDVMAADLIFDESTIDMISWHIMHRK